MRSKVRILIFDLENLHFAIAKSMLVTHSLGSYRIGVVLGLKIQCEDSSVTDIVNL